MTHPNTSASSACFLISAGRLFKAGLLASTLLLAGCAAQQAYREGESLVAQGQVERGLAKFAEATQREPRSAEYRAAYLRAHEQLVNDYLARAEREARAGKQEEAERLYRRTLELDSRSERAQAGLRQLETHRRHERLLDATRAALDKKNPESARLKLNAILSENPQHEEALGLRQSIDESKARPLGEPELSAAYRKSITIEFKDVALKQVFEVISRTSGLNFLFDRDVRTDQKTSIFLKNSTIASAVHFTLLTNQLAQQILDANTILIYPNTPAKAKDYQEMVVKTFYLSHAEAKTVASALKTIIKSRDVVVDDKLNMLIVRDSPEAIVLAEKLIAVQDVPEPEVMLEVEILEVKRTRLLELGVQWPNSLSLAPLPAAAAGTLTLSDLRSLSDATTGAALSPLTVNARKQDSDANILANPRIRARNHEKARILIGERIPNITTTSTATGFVSESINYVDVGLKLEVEPTVYLDNDVAIKIALEVSNIVSQLQTKSGTVAYQIGTRNASTVLRLKDGETQVLAGLINDEDRNSANKVPGLGEMPVVGRLFGSGTDNTQKTEIILSITPRVIRNIRRPEAVVSEFRAGTDSSFRLRPDAAAALPVSPPPPASEAPSGPVTAAPVPVPVAPINGVPTPADESAQSPSNTATPAATAAPAQLRWQGPVQASVGSTFTVQLVMQSDQPVVSLPLAIGFDNKLLQVVSVTEGDFLKQGGARTSFSSRVDPNGQVLMTGVRSGDGGAFSVGTATSITFRAIGPGESTNIAVLSATPGGSDGRPVPLPLPAAHLMRIEP